MKKFKFTLTSDGGKNSYHYYQSDIQVYKRDFEKCQAILHNGANGPKTCFARIDFWHEFFSNQKLGYYIYRHFFGNNTYQQAERWCNFLLNNPPYGAQEYNEDIQRDGQIPNLLLSET